MRIDIPMKELKTMTDEQLESLLSHSREEVVIRRAAQRGEDVSQLNTLTCKTGSRICVILWRRRASR